MKLFAIQMENRETVVATAASPAEALESVGLPAGLLQAENLTGRYKVVELNDLHLRFQCTDHGDLRLCDADQGTFECLFEFYPQLKLG